MELFVVVVFCAIAGVFARELQHQTAQPTEKSEEHVKFPDGFEMKDLCYFGRIPTRSCNEKCEELKMIAYCYRHTKECLCRPSNIPQDAWISDVHGSPNDHLDPSTTPEPLGDVQTSNDTFRLPIIIYMTDFMRLTPFIAGTEDEDYDDESEDWDETALLHGTRPSVTPLHADYDFLWTKEHLAMVLILTLILALVVVELCIVYRKRKSTKYLDDLFKTTPLDDRLVKSLK